MNQTPNYSIYEINNGFILHDPIYGDRYFKTLRQVLAAILAVEKMEHQDD